MSIPRRIFRIATDRLRHPGIDLDDLRDRLSSAGRRAASEAERELEEFLSRPAAAAAAPSTPKAHPLQREFTTLGLEPTRDLQAVQQAWRRKAREHHPDRFAGDPVRQAEAKERFLHFQAAYERIVAHVGGQK